MMNLRNFAAVFFVCLFTIGSSIAVFGQDGVWSRIDGSPRIEKDRGVERSSFPEQFKLFGLDRDALNQRLFAVADRPVESAIISLPNAEGRIERFELFEASNFEPELQVRFPDIRAYSGRGLTDKYATVKLSISPEGIQATIFRTTKDLIGPGGKTEIIEPYSKDKTVYAVFESTSGGGEFPWICETPVELALSSQWTQVVERTVGLESSSGEIRTLRLAQSVNGEYSNYFGATGPEHVGLVLAAINATLTRTNGVYERDFGLHLNLIPETTNIIFYDPATDPYTSLSSWNNELRDAIRNNGITIDMYDIGHMFGASGGGGNAGCIGCVCSNNPNSTHFGHDKGRGITSPADGIPAGDNFDIDYVAHEVGHQLGANHTFSYGQLPVPEMLGQDKEIGSGITIMGYAGISPVSDIAAHSIDVFHATSIEQVQRNLPTRPCPAEGIVPSTGNRPPVVEQVNNYTIPILTPFALTGSATDPDGDAVTYNWEQNDSSENLGATAAYSSANPAKPIGPNFISFNSTSSPTKVFPRLSTILAGEFVTEPHPGGDPNMLMEALSSISRDLNFRLTVRDNHPYVPGVAIGQTQYTDVTVSVTDLAGPFKVAAPDSAMSMVGGTPLTVTWLTANTNLPPVGTTHVNIRMSLNGGLTFPILLKANTPNDGSELVLVPNIGTDTARIKVEAVGNIFFDIGDANFSVLGPTTASIGGRILNQQNGRGVKGATITLTASDGTVRTTVTDTLGNYILGDVPLGDRYVITPSLKRYQFSPGSITYEHFGQTSDQNFVGSNN